MKTKEEIIEYLQSQDWFDKFERNRIACFKHYSLKKFVKLYKCDDLISLSFTWVQTPEGYYYWKGIAEQFAKWYNDGNTNTEQADTGLPLGR